MALFIVERVGAGFTVRPGENTLQAAASALKAEAWAGDSATSAATAEAARDVSIASSVQYPTAAAAVAGLADGAFGSYLDGEGNPVWGQRVGASMVALPGPWIDADKIGSDDGASGTLWTTVAGFITRLMSSAGASAIGFIQAGIGAVARTVQSKLRDTVSVKDFGAVGDGIIDDTLHIQAALSYATSNGFKKVYLPAGVYLITSTLSIGRLSIIGDGDGSRIKPDINDGSAALSVTAGTNLFLFEKFRVDTDLNQSDFISGSINAKNCIGIKINSSGGSYSARFVLRDIIVRGCKVGYDVVGFIATFDNVWSLVCETGLKASEFNSIEANLRFENCRKDFEISNSGGVNFNQLLCEGAALQSGLTSSSIDGCTTVAFQAMYLEQTRNEPFIKFGFGTICQNISVATVRVAMTDNPAKNNDIYPLAFDNVNGLNIGGFYGTGTNQKRYSTTTNTKNIVDNSTASSPANWLTDNSKNLSAVQNYFSNSNFDLWFRGWPAVTIVNAAMSKETVNVRKGINAIKLQLNSGVASGYISFIHNDNYLASKLAGKVVSAYFWVYVPNISEYDPTNRATIAQVAVALYSNGAGAGFTYSAGNSINRGAWNLMKVTRPIPLDATRIDVVLYLYGLGGVATGNENVSIDSVYLVEGSGQDFQIINGAVSNSDLNQCSNYGGKLNMKSDNSPTDSDQVFEVGDTVYKLSPTAGGSLGWICTTGGAGGTAVFKALPNVAL